MLDDKTPLGHSGQADAGDAPSPASGPSPLRLIAPPPAETPSQARATSSARALRTRTITFLVLATGALTLLLAVPALRQVLTDLRHMSFGWVILAIALELASCLSFVVIFRHFFDRLSPPLAGELAWTEMGSGALLPGGGVGSIAAGGWLLHQAGMPTSTILRRSSGLFFLTSATNVAALLLGGALVLVGSNEHSLLLGGPPVAAGLIAAGAVIALPRLLRHHPALSSRSWLSDLIAGIGAAEQTLLRPSWRLLGAIGYLGFDIAVLWATLTAVGYTPPLATLSLGYIIGYLANLIPIPGGIGVLEGGLVGTLVLYGAPPTQTAAAVIVYHAIAFWIPSLGGLIAYRRITSKHSTYKHESDAPRPIRELALPPTHSAHRVGAAPSPIAIVKH